MAAAAPGAELVLGQAVGVDDGGGGVERDGGHLHGIEHQAPLGVGSVAFNPPTGPAASTAVFGGPERGQHDGRQQAKQGNQRRQPAGDDEECRQGQSRSERGTARGKARHRGPESSRAQSQPWSRSQLLCELHRTLHPTNGPTVNCSILSPAARDEGLGVALPA